MWVSLLKHCVLRGITCRRVRRVGSGIGLGIFSPHLSCPRRTRDKFLYILIMNEYFIIHYQCVATTVQEHKNKCKIYAVYTQSASPAEIYNKRYNTLNVEPDIFRIKKFTIKLRQRQTVTVGVH